MCHVSDLTSWRHVSQDGTPEQVLAFLKEQNVHKLSLPMIAWRMSDKDFFTQALTRHINASWLSVINDHHWKYE